MISAPPQKSEMLSRQKAWQGRHHFFLWKTLASMAPDVVSWPILLRNLVLASSPTKLEAMDIELRVMKRKRETKTQKKGQDEVQIIRIVTNGKMQLSFLFSLFLFFFF